MQCIANRFITIKVPSEVLSCVLIELLMQGDSSGRELGFVDLDFEFSTVCPFYGNLEEAAEQLGKMVEHQNQSQPNLGLRADESICRATPTRNISN